MSVLYFNPCDYERGLIQLITLSTTIPKIILVTVEIIIIAYCIPCYI